MILIIDYKAFYLTLRFHQFHLPTNIQQIVFDVFEHVYLRYNELSKTVSLL